MSDDGAQAKKQSRMTAVSLVAPPISANYPKRLLGQIMFCALALASGRPQPNVTRHRKCHRYPNHLSIHMIFLKSLKGYKTTGSC